MQKNNVPLQPIINLTFKQITQNEKISNYDAHAAGCSNGTDRTVMR